jgi:hypothetical protein
MRSARHAENRGVIVTGLLCLLLSFPASAGDGNSVQVGEFTVDPPTLTCLGFAWEIDGDANRNATADVVHRESGAEQWQQALPLLRIGGHHAGRSSDWLDHEVPPMLAGSILNLREDTEYQVRITMRDPDGIEGEAVRTVRVRTRGEPAKAESGNVYHVYAPGSGAKWPQNEFTNLYKAYYGGLGNLGDFNMVWERIVQPGETILVHSGVYKADLDHYTDRMGLVADGTYWLTAKGTPEKPITIKAAGDGEVIFDGSGAGMLFNVMAADNPQVFITEDWHVEPETLDAGGYGVYRVLI